jgi:hypothetical protein
MDEEERQRLLGAAKQAMDEEMDDVKVRAARVANSCNLSIRERAGLSSLFFEPDFSL